VAVDCYRDADLHAGRVLNTRASLDPIPACATVAALRAAHPLAGIMAAYVAGLAFGVRLGKTFAPLPGKRSKWISDEYRRLSESARVEVQRMIRTLLRAQQPVPRRHSQRPADAAADMAAVQRWKQSAGRAARMLR
jgi:hypothetical protein